MTSKPNVIVVQKTTGKGTTIQGLPGKNVVTTLLNAGVSKSLNWRLGSPLGILKTSYTNTCLRTSVFHNSQNNLIYQYCDIITVNTPPTDAIFHSNF
jgi:hypothetical protein